MNIINDAEKEGFKKAYKEFFDSFKETIIIHKKGKVNIVNSGASQLFGYEESANESNYTYTAENKTFLGLVVNPGGSNDTADIKYLSDVLASAPDNQIIIKVEEDCKIYLTSGTVERINVKGKSYSLASRDSRIYKVIDNYFLFKLEEIK